MNKLIAVFICFFYLSGSAQADSHSNAEINAQIWLPFIESYAKGDGDLHASLYSDDIVRVSRGKVQTGMAYIERMREYVNSLADRGGRPISFRFNERSHNENTAYETGVFRLMHSDGTASYGRFEVVIKKIHGSWKLSFDHDQPTDRDAWNAAEPMDAMLIPADR